MSNFILLNGKFKRHSIEMKSSRYIQPVANPISTKVVHFAIINNLLQIGSYSVLGRLFYIEGRLYNVIIFQAYL